MNRSLFLMLIVFGLVGCGQQQAAPPQTKADLPEIATFLTKPSDRFLVDIEDVCRGHPLLGANSPHPHGGGHVHFDNRKNRWPKGKDEPANYPAIYAVADGTVGRIDTHFSNGDNDRYGLDLVFAKDKSGAEYRICYSIVGNKGVRNGKILMIRTIAFRLAQSSLGRSEKGDGFR
jgi:hypothetical protein